MKIIIISALIVLISAFCLWYYFNVKRPEDKRMEEEKKHTTNYEKYKSEVRNFKQ